MKQTTVLLDTPYKDEHLVVFTCDDDLIVNHLLRQETERDLDALATKAYLAQFNKTTVDQPLNVYHPPVTETPAASTTSPTA